VALFRDAVSFTESETGFSGRLIEKDYYCSVVLKDLASAPVADLAFKGGTSLSKVHGDFLVVTFFGGHLFGIRRGRLTPGGCVASSRGNGAC